MAYYPELREVMKPSDEPLCIVPHPLGGVTFQIPNSTQYVCRFDRIEDAKAFAKANGRSFRNLVPKQDPAASTDCLPSSFLDKAFKLIRQ